MTGENEETLRVTIQISTEKLGYDLKYAAIHKFDILIVLKHPCCIKVLLTVYCITLFKNPNF